MDHRLQQYEPSSMGKLQRQSQERMPVMQQNWLGGVGVAPGHRVRSHGGLGQTPPAHFHPGPQELDQGRTDGVPEDVRDLPYNVGKNTSDTGSDKFATNGPGCGRPGQLRPRNFIGSMDRFWPTPEPKISQLF